jgi:hypothetical protein
METKGRVDRLIPHNLLISINNLKGSAKEKNASRQTDCTPLCAHERHFQLLGELFFLIIPTAPV